MKNPITKTAYSLLVLALIYGFFGTVGIEKFKLMVYLVAGITAGLILRAETLGNVFLNVSEGLKEKWKNGKINNRL